MKFTWHDKFTRMLEKVPEEDRGPLALAVIYYGTHGTEPDLPYPLDIVFESFRDDIDYSHKARKNGSEGGKASGRKSAADTASEDETRPLATPLASESQDPLQPNTVQNNTVHSNTSNKEEKDNKKKKFSKPTVEEIRGYADEIGFTSLDAQRFFDYYESNGWKVGRNPMKDWKATVRQWRAREAPKEEENPYAKYD